MLRKPKVNDFEQVMELIETGKVKAVIHQCYPLEQVPQAFQEFGNGGVAGKIIITME